jgi:hypothetical protein
MDRLMGDSAIYLILVVGAVVCAYRAMTEARILSSTIYLACVSAAVAMMLYCWGLTRSRSSSSAWVRGW